MPRQHLEFSNKLPGADFHETVSRLTLTDRRRRWEGPNGLGGGHRGRWWREGPNGLGSGLHGRWWRERPNGLGSGLHGRRRRERPNGLRGGRDLMNANPGTNRRRRRCERVGGPEPDDDAKDPNTNCKRTRNHERTLLVESESFRTVRVTHNGERRYHKSNVFFSIRDGIGTTIECPQKMAPHARLFGFLGIGRKCRASD